MLNEQASSSLDQPIWHKRDYEERKPDPYDDIREKVSTVMHIKDEQHGDDNLDEIMFISSGHQLLITYEGDLIKDSETAYDELDDLLQQDDQFALFRKSDDELAPPHRIHVMQGRVVPVEGRPWLNLLLFLLTLFSVFFAGATYGISGILSDQPERMSELMYTTEVDGQVVPVAPRISQLWRGYPYALSILLILGAHELGHYFAARFHKHAVSLPYFIPMPISALGTMGAVIRSRQPMKNRKVLMDIGAAGPLTGLVFAIPIVLIGLATSEVSALEPGTYQLEGNSILYAVSKMVVHGQFLPSATHDVLMNQMAFAGWLGLLVTALNLIPVGQLDGGHVLYSLFGLRARQAFYPVMIIMVILATLSSLWIIWVILLFLLGRIYAPPLDDITPLDTRRRTIAIVTLMAFILVFVPRPFTTYTLTEDDLPPVEDGQTVQHQQQAETIITLGD